MPKQRTEFVVTVVDLIPKPFRGAKRLVTEADVPMSIAIRWAKVRREMSPGGLKRKLQHQVN